jgi:hypothetical protein
MDMHPPTNEETAIPWDPAKVDEECDNWGDLPDPPEDNFNCLGRGSTNTGDENFLDRDQEIDRLCHSIKFMIEDHEQELVVDNSNIRQQKERESGNVET